MANTGLEVATRTVTGKKLGAVRRNGITPANIYGNKVESTAVQVGTVELTHLLRTSSRNAIIDLKVAGETTPRTVVLRGIQRDPVSGLLLHVDFYQVSMTEKMKAEIPIVLVGNSPAIGTYQGILLHTLESLHVEALPADLPAHVEADVTVLAELEQALHVRDIALDREKVHVLTDDDVVIAKIASPRLAAAEEEEAPAEAAEGEATPAEGAAAAEEESGT